MLVGTYTGGSSVGVYTFRFDAENLTYQPLSQVETDNPSYLAVSSNHDYVYAVSESADKSAVNAFAFDKVAGTLRFLNQKQIEDGPCYILYHESTRTVVTANYKSGTVSFIRVAADGSLTDRQITYTYEGHSIIPERQTSPHLHCIAATPDDKAIFATDLGTDKIHKIDITTPGGQVNDLDLTFKKSSSFTLEAGSGPRHLIFNRKHTFAYLINELSGMVSVLSIDAGNNLALRQSILADTLHAGGSADIHLSPDEKFLYASTRLKGDGIVIFSVNGDGMLKRIGYQATGKHPRNFAITPDGNRMLVACKDSGMIQIFNIDKRTGLLTDSGKTIPVDQPVCIRFLE
jgi:6-phosphogluconolactonase (cycloisomerase 2 family)